MIVYYDSYCKLCTRTAYIWKKFDWRKKLVFLSFRDLPQYPEAMETEMHVEKDGVWHKGFDAVIAVCKQLPLTWPLVPFLHVLNWLHLGPIIYKKIASSRKLFPVGSCVDGACSIHKDKK